MTFDPLHRLLAVRDRRRALATERDQFRRPREREQSPEDLEREQQTDLQKRLAAGIAANKFPPH
jgi:hypothetical protein